MKVSFKAAYITNFICSYTEDNPSLLFSPGLLQEPCVSPLFSNTSSKKTKATVEAVVYHISNETRLIACIPETAMIHHLALARDQALNSVYHCLPGLFNYLANIIDKTPRVPVFLRMQGYKSETCPLKETLAKNVNLLSLLWWYLKRWMMHIY